MPKFTKSLFRFGLAMALFGWNQVENLARNPEAAGKSFDEASEAFTGELCATLHATFHVVDNVQRGLAGMLLP